MALSLAGLRGDRAVEVTEMMLKTKPDVVYSLPAFAKVYFESDSVDAGKAIIANCLRLNPKSRFIWTLLLSLEGLGGQFGTEESMERIKNLAGDFLDPRDYATLLNCYEPSATRK
ncbi:hypothetical protein CcCBS67573_g10390 [Chytriomyces confervae]|uniref:Uncharacterized protein n=1 Tax=Chytriomyces confervae TaxID=246404 RepID=A0A507D0Y5_9FUNG|nr:hypothetical protein CcCBS67573_g10390 [Chytriomyces confervae]